MNLIVWSPIQSLIFGLFTSQCSTRFLNSTSVRLAIQLGRNFKSMTLSLVCTKYYKNWKTMSFRTSGSHSFSLQCPYPTLIFHNGFDSMRGLASHSQSEQYNISSPDQSADLMKGLTWIFKKSSVSTVILSGAVCWPCFDVASLLFNV